MEMKYTLVAESEADLKAGKDISDFTYWKGITWENPLEMLQKSKCPTER